MRAIIALLLLAACDGPGSKTAEGCPIGMTEIGRAGTQACQAAYAEEMARAHGGAVTKCLPDGSSGMSCTTY